VGTGCKANESRVHTRITDSGQKGNSVELLMENQVGVAMGPRSGFDPRCGYGTDAQDARRG